MIWAFIVTSNAETASSAIINFGSRPRALAIQILCLCPPENSCGYLSACLGESPTLFNKSDAPTSICLIASSILNGLHAISPASATCCTLNGSTS